MCFIKSKSHIICIGGKSGSGKTTMANYLQSHLKKSVHLDIDKLNTTLMSTAEAKVKACKLFGESVIINDEIDKKKVASVIYNNPVKYKDWHDFMLELCDYFIKKFIKKNKYSIYIFDHALISESKYFKKADFTICCKAEDETRYRRLMVRDNQPRESIIQRDKFYKVNENIFDGICDGKNMDIILLQAVKKLHLDKLYIPISYSDL